MDSKRPISEHSADPTQQGEEEHEHINVQTVSQEPTESRQSQHRDLKLSVEHSWKGDEEGVNETRSSGHSYWTVGVKWLVTIIVSLVFSGFVMNTEITFLVLTSKLTINDTMTVTDEKQLENTRVVLCLALALIVPYFFNFMRAVWIAGCTSDVPWPNTSSGIMGVGLALLEVAGILLLAVIVSPRYSAAITCCIIRLVTFFPTLDLFVGFMKSKSSTLVTLILSLISSIMQIYGIYGVIRLTLSNGDAWTVVWTWVAFMCLSFAWLPSIQENLVIFPLQEEKDNQNQEQLHTLPPHKETTWKLAIITNLSKCIFVVIVCAVLLKIDSSVSLDVARAFKGFNWNAETQLMTVNVISSTISYGLAIFLCHISRNIRAFYFPLQFAAIAVPVIVITPNICEFISVWRFDFCMKSGVPVWIVWTTFTFISLGNITSFGYATCRQITVFIRRESQIVWQPSYNGFALGPWLLLNKRLSSCDTNNENSAQNSKNTKVYICSTMYRESREEMRELLKSIKAVNDDDTQSTEQIDFESHIIFDDGIKQDEISRHALQLLDLLKQIFGIFIEKTEKHKTPYGLRLQWKLKTSPTLSDAEGMVLKLHLKDSQLVKKKKRWSQVLYMSYIIDKVNDTQTTQIGDEPSTASAGTTDTTSTATARSSMESPQSHPEAISEDHSGCQSAESETNPESYILTTDADVKFRPESVKKLLDLMRREETVGAVCARTHPLGHGPLVWYQIFEYAIGHWFQKSAEHILGEVLCAPGCFSVYRCKALKEVLSKYSSDVEHAFDFLFKDMGEDRWLCSLLIMSGWRIDYCAAAENSTYCPTGFEEFYKQRRRWITSTIANLLLLMKEWKITKRFNTRLSFLFIVYQAALLFAALVGPSSVILIVTGGLKYAWNLNTIATVTTQMFACIVFALACLFTAGRVQIKFAKILTFLYAVLMTAVVVGTAVQIGRDESGKQPDRAISVNIPISVTTLYFVCIGAIVLVTAILHTSLVKCILCGVIYLLCLPSGYLVLLIYTLCNITDRSWGTREKDIIESPRRTSWLQVLKSMVNFFRCKMCRSREATSDAAVQVDRTDVNVSVDEDYTANLPNSITEGSVASRGDVEKVEDWLPQQFYEQYAQGFRKHGYDNTLFISGMTESDLRLVGVETKSHITQMLDKIEELPGYEINLEIPESVGKWLSIIGLERYKDTFEKNNIKVPGDLSSIKEHNEEDFLKFGISKTGHIKRLMKAIAKLRYPNEAQIRESKINLELKEVESENLKQRETEFWKRLKSKCLTPEIEVFTSGPELKKHLTNLRNTALIVLATANILWLILITTIASQGDLTVLGANPVGLAFLVLYGSILLIQFLAMLVHRLLTLIHFLARVPFTSSCHCS